MANASVTISVKDDATAQIRGIAAELQKLQALAKGAAIAGGTPGPGAPAAVAGAAAAAASAGGAGSPAAADLVRAAGDLSAAAASLTASAAAHATAMKQVVQQVKTPATPPPPTPPGHLPKPPAQPANQAHGMLNAFASNAGGGTAMSLIGLAGPLAFAAAVGGVVANSVKLALEFNRTSTAAVFGMTSNAADLIPNLDRFQSAAMGMTDIGIGPGEAARMMGTYAMASGRDADNVIGESRNLGEWAKARGLDPTQFGQQAAIIGQNAGPNVNANMGQIFGAAAQEGDFGRRQTEMLGTIASLLSRTAASNPGGQPSLTDALREITGITGLGGYFATTAGAATTLGAQQAFGAGGGMYNMQLGARAGFSQEDMLLGTSDPKLIAAKAQVLYAQTEGMHQGNKADRDLGRLEMEAGLKAAGLSNDQARAMATQMQMRHGVMLGGAITPANKDARIDALKDSPAGIAAATAANFEAGQTKMGQDLIKNLGPLFKDVSEMVKDFGMANTLLGIIATAAVVQGGAGLLGKLGGLGRLGAMAATGLAGLGVAGVVAAGALATGAFVATTGVGQAGDADESDPNAAWRKGSKAKSDRAGMSGGSLGGNARSKMAYLRNLWVKAGGPPEAADQMALVAMNESGGNPNEADSVTGTHIGLWQNSQSYSHGNLRDPLLNAQVAVRLYKARIAAHQTGLEDWEDSRNKGAYGGWSSARSQRELEGSEPTASTGRTQRTSMVRTPTHDVQVSVVVTPKDHARVTGGTTRTGAYTA